MKLKQIDINYFLNPDWIASIVACFFYLKTYKPKTKSKLIINFIIVLIYSTFPEFSTFSIRTS